MLQTPLHTTSRQSSPIYIKQSMIIFLYSVCFFWRKYYALYRFLCSLIMYFIRIKAGYSNFQLLKIAQVEQVFSLCYQCKITWVVGRITRYCRQLLPHLLRPPFSCTEQSRTPTYKHRTNTTLPGTSDAVASCTLHKLSLLNLSLRAYYFSSTSTKLKY